MEHDPKRLQAVLQQAAPPDLPLLFRPMFGGIMGYAGGKPFASLSNVGLALKLGGADHAALLAQPGAAALRYEPDQPASKSYVVVPDAMLSDPALLRPWIARSAANLPAAKPRRRPAARA
jgi:TfoX/Sxy family transcriptional regulator of competence genes